MYRNSFLFLFLVFSSFGNFAQTQPISNWYSWFDREVGAENTSLFNGVEYIELHRVINDNHKFFYSADFSPGSIVYSNEPFFQVSLKYNVYDDEVIVRPEHSLGSSMFKLIRSKIKEFYIGKDKFVVIDTNDQNGISGVYQVISESMNFSVYKKNRKKMLKRTNDRSVYYEFETIAPLYIFKYGGKYYPLDRRNDIMAVFPEFDREIKEFYRNNRKKLKENSDFFMKALAGEVISLVSSHSNSSSE